MKDDIIKLAKQCGHWSGETIELNDVGIMDFANLIAAHEREACAKVCDEFQARDVGMQPAECAGAIRARS